MDEETLNNTVIVQGSQHIGGFVLLERIDDRRWRAEQWSAFFIRLLLPENSCRLYLDDKGCAVAELSASVIEQLSYRLELVCEQLPDRMTFVIPENLKFPESAFVRWKNSLPKTQAVK